MPEVNRTALVSCSAEKMFSVVDDIEAYPRFLPWCAASRVVSRSETEVVASLDIARGGMKQSFTTRNTLDRPRSIRLALIEGPFAELTGQWTFEPLGDDGCKVSLNLSFVMDSRIMGAALGAVFSVAADRMVDAFCERAEANP